MLNSINIHIDTKCPAFTMNPMTVPQSTWDLFLSLNREVKVLEKARESFNDHLALGFNTISEFFYPDENKLSDMLAFLLDPNASHAQGCLFLELFDKQFDLKLNPSEASKIDVKREDTTAQNRRMDIVIDCDGRKCVIENKIWAADQKDQLKDYIDEIKQRSNEWKVIYLTPHGDKPSEDSLPEDRREEILCLSHGDDIPSWLSLCVGRCKSDKVRDFINVLISYTQQEFGNSMIEDEIAACEQFLEKHPDICGLLPALESARWNVQKGIEEKSFSIFGELFFNLMNENGYLLNCHISSDTVKDSFKGWYQKSKGWPRLRLGILQNEENPSQKAYFTIQCGAAYLLFEFGITCDMGENVCPPEELSLFANKTLLLEGIAANSRRQIKKSNCWMLHTGFHLWGDNDNDSDNERNNFWRSILSTPETDREAKIKQLLEQDALDHIQKTYDLIRNNLPPGYRIIPYAQFEDC